jgi:hypothetical protein
MGKGNMVIKRPKAKISASAASLSPSALSRRLDKRDRKGNAQIQKIVACPYQISRSTFPEHALMRRH